MLNLAPFNFFEELNTNQDYLVFNYKSYFGDRNTELSSQNKLNNQNKSGNKDKIDYKTELNSSIIFIQCRSRSTLY